MNKKSRSKAWKNIRIWLGITLLFVIPFILFFVFKSLYSTNQTLSVVFISIFSAMMIASLALLIYNLIVIFQRNSLIKNTLNYHIENEIAKEGVGVVIFDERTRIIWVSKFISQRFGSSIIGKNLKNYVDFDNIDSEQFSRKINYEDFDYEMNVDLTKNVAVIKDVTDELNVFRIYDNEKITFGEVEIDNMSLYQSIYSEEEIFKIYNAVVSVLDDLTAKHDFVYRRYVNNNFFIITTNETLKKLMSLDFKQLTNIECNDIRDKNIRIPISVGFAYGLEKLNDLTEKTKDALSQSKARGGDQITVIEKNNKPIYFGSRYEVAHTTNRTRMAHFTAEVMEKMRSSKIDTVLIYGHKLADLDALGSAYAFYLIAHSLNKRAFIQNKTFDPTCQRSINRYLNKNQNIFITPKQATKLNSDSTMVLVVDCATEDRIENKNAFKNVSQDNIFVFDHHRISRSPDYVLKQNLYVDTGASSASEIVTEFIMFSHKQKAITNEAAQMLLDGIYMDTNRFLKTTSSRTFFAASFLEELGASSATSIETLKMDENVYEIVSKILSNLREVKPGYFLATYEGDVESDVVSIAADEILRIQGRKAAFVVAKIPGIKQYKMSARGIDTNVQIIAEAVNGGGHFAAAAAVSDENEPMETFVDNIIQAIVSVKNESYNN
ncbi:GGDEF domain-containing protein [Mycoplasma sp. 4044]